MNRKNWLDFLREVTAHALGIVLGSLLVALLSWIFSLALLAH